MGLGKTYSTRYLADSNNNTGASDQVLSSTPTGISWVNADTLSTGFWLADGNDIYNSNPGFVGIGTTDPQNDLDVVSADPTLLLRFDGSVNGANSGRIKFSEGGTNHVGHMEIHYDGAANKMYFNSPIDGNTGLMTIERTGDVGINTTNPTSKLHIAKTTTWGEMSNPIINIQNNGTGGNINTAHNMGSITWLSGTVSTAEIKAIRNTPASGDNVELRFSTSASGVQGERMTINNTGVLKLSAYGAGIMQTSSDGTVSSGGDIDIDESVIINDNLVNYKFTALENTGTQYWLLCYNAGSNDVNGTLWGDRSSGHHQAMNLDIVVSAKSASMQTGMLTTKQVLESNEKYTLVTLTYNSNNYIAIKYDGHPYPITNHGYFTGLLKSTIGSDFLLAVNGASVSAVAAFSNANTKATIQANKVGIGTADPGAQLQVEGAATGDDTPQLIIASGGVDNNSIIHFTDDDGDQVNAIGSLEGNMLTLASQNELVFKTGTGSILGNTDTRMTITASGDVGIGNISPDGKLDIFRTATNYAINLSDTLSRAGLVVKSSGSFDSKITFSSGATNRQYIQATNNATTTGRDIAINPYGGNVGVGTTSPDQKLTVNGRALIQNSTTPFYIKVNSTYKSWVHHIASDDTYVMAPSTADGGETWDWSNQVSFSTAGVCKTNNFQLNSDIRHKTKIEDLTGDNIDISWKSFEMKGNEGDYRTGVIAQELEETHPEFVDTDDRGYKSVKYIDLLIAKIAELEARLEKAGI